MPPSRSASKSYTQLRVSAQRPCPGTGQFTMKGSSKRGSPSATMGALNRAVTWRTCLTYPSGEKDWTCAWASVAGSAPAGMVSGRVHARNPRTQFRRADIRNLLLRRRALGHVPKLPWDQGDAMAEIWQIRALARVVAIHDNDS